MKYVSIVYTALLWALALAVACLAGSWLPAQVNAGVLFLGAFVVLVIALLVALRARPAGIGLAGTTASLMTCVLVGLVFAGPDALATLPASLVGVGADQQGVSLGAINIALVIVLVLGYGAVLAGWLVRRGAGVPGGAAGSADTADGPASGSAAGSIDPASPSDTANPAANPAASDDDAKLRRTTRFVRWVTFVVLFVVVAVCACVPTVRAQIGEVFARLSSGDIDAVAELIRSYGPYAAAVSFLLMVLQSLAAPIPAFLITFANAAVFGWWQGAILSWSSAMAGAAVCFLIARILGRDAVAHFVSHGALASVDRFFDRYGKNAILICRLLPFMSFDIVSYAAGLTGMGFWGFFWATGLGQLPATIVYSYVGGMLTGGARLLMTALLIIFALFALVALVRKVYTSRHRDLMGAAGPQLADEPQAAGEPQAVPTKVEK